MLTDEQKNKMPIWYVQADHPVLKQGDKFNMFKNEAIQYISELKSYGYENIRMDAKV